MLHTCTVLQLSTNADGTVELVYDLDGHVDSRRFDDLDAVSKEADPLQTTPQVLALVIPFWQGQNDPITGESVTLVGRKIEIDFQAVSPNPQIRFVDP